MYSINLQFFFKNDNDYCQEILHIHIIWSNTVHFSLILKLIPQSLKTNSETISVHEFPPFSWCQRQHRPKCTRSLKGPFTSLSDSQSCFINLQVWGTQVFKEVQTQHFSNGIFWMTWDRISSGVKFYKNTNLLIYHKTKMTLVCHSFP